MDKQGEDAENAEEDIEEEFDTLNDEKHSYQVYFFYLQIPFHF